MIEKTISADKLRKVIVDRSERDGKPVPKVMLEGLSLRELSNISTAPADKRIEYARQYQRANFGGAADEFGEGGSVDAEFKFGGKVDRFFPYQRFWENAQVKKQPKIRAVEDMAARRFAFLSTAQCRLLEKAFQDMFALDVTVEMDWEGWSTESYIPYAQIKFVDVLEGYRFKYHAAYAGLRTLLLEMTSFIPQIYGYKSTWGDNGKLLGGISLYVYQADVWRPMQEAIKSKKQYSWRDMLEMKRQLRVQQLEWSKQNLRSTANPYKDAVADLWTQNYANEWKLSPRERELQEKFDAEKRSLYAPAFALGGEIFGGDSPFFWMH